MSHADGFTARFPAGLETLAAVPEGAGMSRRKQARPLRLLDDEPPPPPPRRPRRPRRAPPGESSGSGSEEEVRSNGELSENRSRRECEEAMPSDPEDMVVSGDEDMEEPEGEGEGEGEGLDQVRRHRQDAENNNSLEEGEAGDAGEAGEGGEAGDASARLVAAGAFPFPAASHVTLEALQNTKVAVAQFAATTMANNADNEAALQELAVLQSTLFTLQHQQVFQLQLIQQLQNQLSLNRHGDGSPATPPIAVAVAVAAPPRVPVPRPGPPTPSPPKTRIPTREPTPVRFEPPTALPASQAVPPSHPHPQPPAVKQEPISIPKPPTPSPPSHPMHNQYTSISSSLASTIITNNDPPPSLNEPNTLEMLQRRAQEVLDSASQGLLANNLADELAFRKSGKMSPYDGKSGGRNEPFFKHRCRYCGKVFGSDSALQIHIRSHTGERPFKCNVCGSRFTTKGNLKVHFQRHTAKFPHVKMNPNPIPEHLDKYHPPLLAQLSPGPMPGMPPHPLPFPPGGAPFPPGLPLYRPPPHRDAMPPRPLGDGPPAPPHPLFALRDEQDSPADLSKPAPPSPPPPAVADRFKREPPEDDRARDRASEEGDRLTPKLEPDTDRDSPDVDRDPDGYPNPPSPYDECSMDSKYSSEDMQGRDTPDEKRDPDQPENLSSKTSSVTGTLSIPTGRRAPSSYPFFPAASPPSSVSSGSLSAYRGSGPAGLGATDVDPTRDPFAYGSLLPRPGSNDSSWESLIEVTKTSETSKLQRLVDNIEHKLTDPNQCVICQRVLSCKSALQMHYRTHTGERPFRCRICGRAFTTKGNLKTHMGVHRMKPPTRVLHQCPVCHRKFTNALVLQQHIRLHTGEPTDLTPEQIRAAEIRETPGCFPFPPQGFPSPGAIPAGSLRESDRDSTKDGDFSNDGFAERDDFDDDSTQNDPDASREARESFAPSFAASLAALESRVGASAASRSSGESFARGTSTPAPFCDSPPPPPSPRPTPPGAPFSPLGLAPGPAVRGNTTCNICYKTFACHSALEIHYRSHTKERPFKCTVCDRGFSTKSSGGGCLCQGRSSDPRRPPKPQSATALNHWSPFSLPGNMKQHMLTHKIRESSESADAEPPEPPPKRAPPDPDLPLPKRPSNGPPTGVPPHAPPPLAAGPPGAPPLSTKHLCGVCRKNFSSSSALQIHMRTHTGDKPFRCSVCQKAFTTKGNLKVHMGTHMWSNGASRRGRRMSLELPPRPLPLSPQDSEFLQRRPDLFYPYLPAPFLNGMQQKLNEISVIQQGGGQNGLASPGGKFPGLLGFGAFPPPPVPASQPASPLSDRQPSSLSSPPPDAEEARRERDFSERDAALLEERRRELAERDAALLELAERGRPPAEGLPRMWELHYERKSGGDGPERMGGSPAGPLPLPLLGPPPRGEGLAA